MVTTSHPQSAVAPDWSLTRSWEPELVRHAKRLVRDEAQAQDIVQDALRRLLIASPTPDNPRAWLLRVVRTLSLDWLRNHDPCVAFSEHVEPLDLSPSPNARADLSEVAAFFERELPRLTPLERRILHRIAFEDATIREIAESETLSKSTVFRTIQQLRHKLSTAFAAEFGDSLQPGSPSVRTQFAAWFVGLEGAFGPTLRKAVVQTSEAAAAALDRVFHPLEEALAPSPSVLANLGALATAAWTSLQGQPSHLALGVAPAFFHRIGLPHSAWWGRRPT